MTPPKIWIPGFGIDPSRKAWNPVDGQECPRGQYTLSRNLGDDLQSLAVERIARAAGLGVGHYERDTLARSEPMGAGRNVLCLTGWFSHSPDWPRLSADPWVPLFLGYHDSASGENGRLGALRALAERSPWPIGCRDRHTAEVFRRAGVPDGRIWVSGCATLTLPESDLSDRPLAVDVPAHVWTATLARVSSVWLRASHWLPEDTARDPGRRRAAALEALVRLSRARLVVTSRLHAALPALAAGRRVVFLHSDPPEPRLRDYLDLFPVVRNISRHNSPLERDEVLGARPRDEARESVRRRAESLAEAVRALAGWR